MGKGVRVGGKEKGERGRSKVMGKENGGRGRDIHHVIDLITDTCFSLVASPSCGERVWSNS